MARVEARLNAATKDAAQSPPKKNRSTWFWVNVGTLCVVAPWATYWFQRHLQLYFTEIVVIGGAFSLWVFVRAMWAMLEKAAKVEPWDLSRKLLALPDVTGILLVAVVALLVLWFRTASLYLEYRGAPGEGQYVVEVVRKADGSPLIPSATLTAANKVVGRPFLWLGSAEQLECRVLRPVRYEVLPCSLEPGASTRLAVPSSFSEREFHLLRLVPIGSLYSELPAVDESPLSRYDLELVSGGNVVTLTDLRRQAIYTGATAIEMPILMELEPSGALELQLRSQLLAKRYDSANAELIGAILSLAAREWPTVHVKAGDKLALTVRVTRPQSASPRAEALEGFPVHYTVTTAKVQTVWLPE
jgi:hypothetical protein